MALIEDELSSVFSDRVKFKKGSQKGLSNRDTARLMSSNCPEVMAKITGFSGGGKHVAAHLNYIGRDTNELENEKGQVFTEKEEMEEVAEDWMTDIKSYKTHKRQRDVMHLMLSMPEGTNPQAVKNAARTFASEEFGHNHEYVFALHTDTPHPHVHLAVKMQGFDASRINPKKADLQEWREGFARELRGLGVSAVATPRKARGKTKKAVNSVIYHINKGDKTHKPRIAKITALQTRETTLELITEGKGQPPQEKPWIKKIKQAQFEVREAYKKTIDLLLHTGGKEDQQQAKDLSVFLSNMPQQLITQNEEMRLKIYADISASRTKNNRASQSKEQKPDKDIDR